MKKRIVSLLLAVCMILSLLTGCGSDKKSTDSNTGSDDNGTYTYRQTYSSVSTWSPTDWEISSEWDLLVYTASEFYGFWMNETKDGYDIVCELASKFPIDKTADYAGNETYGVPADATEGYAWQVSIRDDATWEDGTPITVDDIEYSIQQFLNPEMKNYRASLLYSGSVGLANGEDYYNNDKAGKAKLTVATDLGIAMSDLTAGSDGQYADKDGNKAYFGWSNPINNDWMQGYALTDYADYMSEDVYNSLDALANEDGYIPMTDESIKLLHSFTGSADWGGESEEDLINYAYREDGITEEIPWENVGFVKNDDYTFTLVLKNPTTLFNFESDIDNVILVKKDLYEANKQDTGGIYKSSYGTAVDKFSSYGPYKITSYQESKEIKLEKNENWYGYKDGNHEGQYQTTNILWQQIDEHTTQLSMFLQGNLDIVGLASDDMEKYGTSDYVYYTPESYTYYLALNTDFDMLKSRESDGVNKTILTYNDFRKAISFAIDRNDYVKSCTAGCNPAYGLLNDIYICDPDTGATYRDTEYAQKTLCDVYEVDDLDNLTGYDKKKASELLQSAYDQCKKDGNISDTDVIEIDYHSYGSEAIYQKRVDYVQDALLEAAKGTSLEGRIKLNLVEDQDLYNTMKAGQDDMILGAWGGADLDPYSMMICYTDPTYINEYGFDPYQNLTISVQGEDITMSFYDWYNELYTGTYAVAERDVRNEILAGIEKGLLLNYHVIPIDSSCAVSLYSQRVIPGSEEYINSIVQRGGIQFLTYTMNDDEWDAYCKEQGNNLSY
ncbi:MAG: ABC transporter substrate-binding protein [Lachnospiraceae bacterium]|nr:ABC transporter substrate-binding protein [Lachnospiraceae bacterium]